MKTALIIISLVFVGQFAFAQAPERSKVNKQTNTREEQNKQTTTPDKKNESQEKQRTNRGESTSSWQDVEILFTKPFIFSKGELQVSGEDVEKKEAFVDAINKSNAVVKEYKTAIDNFLQGNPPASIYINKLKTSEAKAKGLVSNLTVLEKEFKSSTSLGGVYYLQKIYLYKGYLESQTKVFPESEILKEHLKKADDAIQTYGSTDEFLAKMVENKKEYTKNLKLIPAAQKNKKIEDLVKLKFQEFEKNWTVTKVNITYPDWRIEKNELDIPLNRKLSVSIGLKNTKGECGLAGANVYEEYIGSGNYGETIMYLPSSVTVVPCENIQ